MGDVKTLADYPRTGAYTPVSRSNIALRTLQEELGAFGGSPRKLAAGSERILDEAVARFEKVMIATALRHSAGRRQDAARLKDSLSHQSLDSVNHGRRFAGASDSKNESRPQGVVHDRLLFFG